jgi:signal transduction histidine kinase
MKVSAMQSTTDLKKTPQNSPAAMPWLDLAIVAVVTVTVGATAVYIEFNEVMFAATRRWEVLQLDEAPITLLALTISLAWFAWRRYRDTRAELARRRAAEERTADLLRENRRLAQQYLELQESERKILAHELHDELGQYLNTIKLDAVAIQQRATEEPALRLSTSIIRHADHVYAVVGDLIRKLRPIGLEELGLRAALEHFLDGWRRRLPDIHFEISLDENLDDLDESQALALYRLLQEGLTNIAKHARARHVDVRVERGTSGEMAGAEVLFSLIDDGRGADLRDPTSGLGLVGMRERVATLGGRFEVVTRPSTGFRIIARFPVRTDVVS